MRIDSTIVATFCLGLLGCDPAGQVDQNDLAVQVDPGVSEEAQEEVVGALGERCPQPEKCIVKACFDARSMEKIDCAECGDDGCYVDGNFEALCLCESVTPDEGLIPCMLCGKDLGLYLCQPPI